MTSSRRSLLAALAALSARAAASAQAQVPRRLSGQLRRHDRRRQEGRQGRHLQHHRHRRRPTPLIKDFKALYPGITVEYNDMNSTEVYNRFISERAAGAGSADVLWSSSMDLQIKLANDGGALDLRVARDRRTCRPGRCGRTRPTARPTSRSSIVYNKRLLTGDEIPQSHADLMRVFTQKADKLKGKVTTYDIEKSGVGFMLITQDSKYNPQFWDFVKALGSVRPRLQSSAGTMMERISSGENLLGFNIFSSYAALRAKKDPSIGIVLPKDYTLVMSRVMFISKTREEPERGQAVARLHPVQARPDDHRQPGRAGLDPQRRRRRDDGRRLTKQLGARLKPIPVGAELLGYLDQTKRLEFLKQWQAGDEGAASKTPARDGHAAAARASSSRLTALAVFLPLGPDLLPEPAQRAVLHAAARRSASARSSSSSPTAISGTRSRTRSIIAAGMALIAVPLGGILAFLMVRTDLPGRRWIEPLLLIPVFVSPMVLAFGYVVAAGPVGFYSVWAKQLLGGVPWNVYSLTEHRDHRRA